MREDLLKLAEIVSWYRSKQRALEGSGVSLVEVIERTELLPAAAADFKATNTMGRINGWISGEFDFEVVQLSDGKDVYWRHAEVSAVDGLEGTYNEFIRHMLNPGEPDDTESSSTSSSSKD